MVTIDGYPIDAALNEDHNLDSEATDHPVETGGDITDHIRPKPIRITLDCVVSDTPFGEFAVTRGIDGVFVPGQTTHGVLPSDDAYSRLVEIRDRREPVTIETSLQTFDNMVLESLSIPRNAENGDALRFRAAFKQVILITNNRTTVRVAVPRVAKKQNKGSKPTEEVKQEPVKLTGKRKSGLRHLYEGVTGDVSYLQEDGTRLRVAGN